MRVAIIHFVLLYMSGAERVLQALCDQYPDADIFTHVYDPTKISPDIKKHNIQTTFINKLPLAKKLYKYYLPLMPYALEELNLLEYDLIISCESGPTKGIVPNPDALHVCYCHSPMRYVWDMYHEYANRRHPLLRVVQAYFYHRLKIWDTSSADRVDFFIANSSFVKKRIKSYYRREAKVLPPPVNTHQFEIQADTGDYYLWLGRLVHYKRPDIPVEAFKHSDKHLVMIGAGEELETLRKKAGSNTRMLGFQSFDVMKEKLEHCKALIFPGVEDAGIVPVEAMAAGKPVIAYNKGGLKDTMIDGKTGVLYDDQSPAGLMAAVEKFEAMQGEFDPEFIKQHAEKFSYDGFKEKFVQLVDEYVHQQSE